MRPQQGECYMMLGICLKKFKDMKNAYLVLEKATLLPEALKNPLIYLNFALFCYEIKDDEKSKLYLDNFYKMRDTMHVSKDYIKRADKLKKLLNFEEAEKDITFDEKANLNPEECVKADEPTSGEQQDLEKTVEYQENAI